MSLPPTGPAGNERITSLDGLRAISLLVIMGYHFGVGWLPGGFLGVDVFYVLSGYLITGLLVGERAERGRIALAAFWLRRARRLLPALLAVLVAATLMVRWAEPAGLFPDYRTSALSALFYFSNWWQIAASSNYFVVTGATSPLTHTWSLAVEEQYYLVWPLVVAGVMHRSRTVARGIQTVAAVSVVGALASAVEMAVLYHPGTNVTRIYVGTDTHAQSILIGSALACGLTMVQRRRGLEGSSPRATSTRLRVLLTAFGLAGLVGTLVLASAMDGSSGFAYRGGLFLASLAAAALIMGAVCVPGGLVDAGLSLRPLVWLGTVSYGAYLWHYPVSVYLDPDRTGLSGVALLAVRSGCTIGLAAASYSLIERPVMEGRFWRSPRAIAPAAALVAATVVVVLAGTAATTVAAVRVTRFVSPPAARRPATVVVLGDSTALTLGSALAATAPVGTAVVSAGLFGCGLAIGSSASNHPPEPGLAMFPACNQATPTDQQWPALDAAAVAGTARGDVVLFVAGTWETQDLLVDSKWTNIDQLWFRRYLLAQMRVAVAVATRHGAHLDFTTMPALASGAAMGAAPFPEDSPERRLAYDGLVTAVSRQFPGQVSVIDLGKILSPAGAYTQFLDGVQVRTADGVHTPSYDPGNVFVQNSSEAVAHAFSNWLSPRIWPLIMASAGP